MGESTLKVHHFSPKKWCIMNIIVYSKLIFWWYSLAILNTRKNLKNSWQPFGIQSLLWVKIINFDPMVRWRGLDQINVHIIYNL